MIFRLKGILLSVLLAFGLIACSKEVVEDPVPHNGNTASFVATIGQRATRTLYTEGADANNDNRPYLKALWGGANAITETITLFAADGTSCGNFSASIPAGGAEQAEFSGVLPDENLNPTKAYYSKGRKVESLSAALDLTSQFQAASGSTAHISGQDFMTGVVTMPQDDSDAGSIVFSHITSVIKYILDFGGAGSQEPESLKVKLLTLKQTEGDPVLKLKHSFDGATVSALYSNLDLSFREDNGTVTVPSSTNKLEAFVSIFPSNTQNCKFTIMAQAVNALYSSGEFTVNSNLESGKLYTIEVSMEHLDEYDWYFNPAVNDKGELIYTINTAEELATFSKIVNGDAGLQQPDSFKGKTVKLGSDIDNKTLSLEEYDPWIPIGKSENTPFEGTFDGGGNTIKDLKTDPSKDNQGFFGFVDGATIKNLTIEGEIQGQKCVAAFAANANNSTFTDCSFGSSNMANLYVKGLDWIGSIIGHSTGSVIQVCRNYGRVEGGDGGYVGGLIGWGESTTIKGSTNFGNVSVGAGGVGGGMAGMMAGGYISGCSNRGEVTSLAGEMARILAGIAGEMANKVQVVGSYNDGGLGDDGWAFGTGDYVINGSYYTKGKGETEYFRSTISAEDYKAMNELIGADGVQFGENGMPVIMEPTDFGDVTVGGFEGGGYLN